ncbi:hypothetical protein ACH4TE_35205 [Streptomyces sioyaensis]|uniref:hypothetical protein n=1 Tax=Streptomyces sioyaensis TaxID=67364 RepID=UPI00378B8086
MEPPRSISVDDHASEPAYRFGTGLPEECQGRRPQSPTSGRGEPSRPGSRPLRGSELRLLAHGLDR